MCIYMCICSFMLYNYVYRGEVIDNDSAQQSYRDVHIYKYLSMQISFFDSIHEYV